MGTKDHDALTATTLAPPGTEPTVHSSGTKPDVAPSAGDYAELIAMESTHYVRGEPIAQGGMGRIVVARDRRLGRAVAIKELIAQDDSLRRRFEREVRITARLQHPSIVGILEAGLWPSGEPFFAMELVAGQSLDRVAASKTTLAARLSLLPTVIAAVDALAYAHSRGVIHRDLKPQNILVGEFGETVVIDWGLAKDRSIPADDAPMPGATLGDDRMTVAGAVMGTPAYMPPEQAAGGVVDERADVYALGAILYHVLTGEPPYTGKTSKEILERVLHAAPAPLGQRVPDLSPDLATIIHKALARVPADRYPSARELAEDLRHYQTGRLVASHRYSRWQLFTRFVRRNRLVLTVAAVLLAVLAVTATISVRQIIAERNTAQRERVAAEDLLDFMLFDLRDKLEPIGRLDLLGTVANKAEAYYAVRDPASVSEDNLRRQTTALTNISQVLEAKGDSEGALRAARKALAIADRFSQAREPRWLRSAEVSHNRIGDLLRQRGDPEAAIAEYRKGLALATDLAARDPHDAGRQTDLLISHGRIGDIHVRRGDHAAALPEYRASLAVAAELARRSPGDLDLQRNLSVSHNKVGGVLMATGAAGAALEEYKAAMAIAEDLERREPTNVLRTFDVAIGHMNIGDALLARGDVDAALASQRAARASAAKLAEREPKNVIFQTLVSQTHQKIGKALVQQRQHAAAVTEYEASLAIATTVATADAGNTDWQVELATIREALGDARLALGQRDAALVDYRAARAIDDALLKRDASNHEWIESTRKVAEKIARLEAP